MTHQLTSALIAALFTVMVWCVWTDVTQRQIANTAVIALAALYPLAWAAGVFPGSTGAGISAAVAVSTVGLAGFTRGLVGGGDVKLATALGLWAGSSDFAGFVLATAFTGAGLSLLILATRNLPFAHYLAQPLRPDPQTSDRIAQGESVPYGVALAAGGLWIAYGLIAA